MLCGAWVLLSEVVLMIMQSTVVALLHYYCHYQRPEQTVLFDMLHTALVVQCKSLCLRAWS